MKVLQHGQESRNKYSQYLQVYVDDWTIIKNLPELTHINDDILIYEKDLGKPN